MRPLDLSTKDTYLKWVTDWKSEFKEVAIRSRQEKALKRAHRNEARRIRTEQRMLGGGECPRELAIAENAMTSAYYEVVRLRWRARMMLDARAEGKRLSWIRKLENARALENAVENASEWALAAAGAPLAGLRGPFGPAGE